MTFEQAEAKLAELAKGEYHALSYELTVTGSGEKGAECGLYLRSTSGWHIEPTWAEAFRALERDLNGDPTADISEKPGEELTP